jgi:predicted glycosyltransferase
MLPAPLLWKISIQTVICPSLTNKQESDVGSKQLELAQLKIEDVKEKRSRLLLEISEVLKSGTLKALHLPNSRNYCFTKLT